MPCDSGKPCDCDDDGYNADTAECQHDGGDCDDHDPLVHPGQTSWFTQPSSHGSWDYNCNGTDDLEYTSLLMCSGSVSCDTTTEAWSGMSVPPCGQTGSYGTCMGLAPSCVEKITGMRMQGCH